MSTKYIPPGDERYSILFHHMILIALSVQIPATKSDILSISPDYTMKNKLVFAIIITLTACASIDHEARTEAYNIELNKARNLTTAKQFRDHLNYVSEQCKRLHLEDRGAVGSDLANKERKRCDSVYDNIVSIAKSKGYNVDPRAEKRAQTAAFWGNALAAMAGVGQTPTQSTRPENSSKRGHKSIAAYNQCYDDCMYLQSGNGQYRTTFSDAAQCRANCAYFHPQN